MFCCCFFLSFLLGVLFVLFYNGKRMFVLFGRFICFNNG